ncbi:MAG: hypothetical protein NT014_06450 [Candidatus Omnitrophica bacterium]|nr:hypothetical protein [Candidatus Omnitrophota bacterium]
MTKIAFTAAVLLAISAILFSMAYAENDENVSLTQTDKELPEGMEVRHIDNKPGYKVVVPKGTSISKVGDLRVIEGPGEYTARKSVEYDERLTKMNSDIESLRKEIDEIKDTLSQMQKPKQ